MSDYVEGADRTQALFLPDVLDDYVDEENEVRFIDAFVDSLDLVQLGFTHSEPKDEGRPPYDPSDLLKLYVYGYMNQVRTSRKLEKECCRNTEVMWLMKKLTPDFKTIADFRKDNIDCIKAVFREFVKLCMSLDLFGKKFIGIDGVKLKAVNSIDRNLNKKTLSKKLKEMDERVSRYVNEMEELDRRDEESGSNRTEFLRENLKKIRQKKELYVGLLKKLKESKQNEVSLTDPDSRLMKNRGKLEPCYNSHIAVDDKHHLIADYNVTNVSADSNQLSPIAKSAKDALGVEKIEAASDRGFFDAVEIKECIDNGITPYVPEQRRYGLTGQVKKFGIPTPQFYGDKFVYDRSTDTYTCPAGKRLEFWYRNFLDGKWMSIYKTKKACFSCPFFMTKCTRNKLGRLIERWEHEELIDEMRGRMKLHPEKMDERKKLVEHPFGTMKRAFNQGYLLMKGLRKVTGEVGFTMLAYNMRRAINIMGPKALLTSIL